MPPRRPGPRAAPKPMAPQGAPESTPPAPGAGQLRNHTASGDVGSAVSVAIPAPQLQTAAQDAVSGESAPADHPVAPFIPATGKHNMQAGGSTASAGARPAQQLPFQPAIPIPAPLPGQAASITVGAPHVMASDLSPDATLPRIPCVPEQQAPGQQHPTLSAFTTPAGLLGFAGLPHQAHSAALSYSAQHHTAAAPVLHAQPTYTMPSLSSVPSRSSEHAGDGMASFVLPGWPQRVFWSTAVPHSNPLTPGVPFSTVDAPAGGPTVPSAPISHLPTATSVRVGSNGHAQPAPEPTAAPPHPTQLLADGLSGHPEEWATLPASSLTSTRFVPGAPLPALRAGEDRVCGLTLHPALAAWFRSLETAWIKEHGDEESHEVAVTDVFTQVSINPRYWTRAKELCGGFKALRQAVAHVLGITGLDPLPAVGELQGVAMVGEDRAPSGQRRGRGLIAIQELPPGTVLGPLGGYMLPGGLQAGSLATAQFQARQSWLEPGAAGGEGSGGLGLPKPVDWALDTRRYTFEVPFTVLQPPEHPGGDRRALETTVAVWGLGYGNLAMLVNDAVAKPAKWASEGAYEAHPAAPDNCEVLVVEVRGMPLPVLVTSRAVAAGQALLRGYGRGWWQAHHIAAGAVRSVYEEDEGGVFEPRELTDSRLAQGSIPVASGASGARVLGSAPSHAPDMAANGTAPVQAPPPEESRAASAPQGAKQELPCPVQGSGAALQGQLSSASLPAAVSDATQPPAGLGSSATSQKCTAVSQPTASHSSPQPQLSGPPPLPPSSGGVPIRRAGAPRPAPSVSAPLAVPPPVSGSPAAALLGGQTPYQPMLDQVLAQRASQLQQKRLESDMQLQQRLQQQKQGLAPAAHGSGEQGQKQAQPCSDVDQGSLTPPPPQTALKPAELAEGRGGAMDRQAPEAPMSASAAMGSDACPQGPPGQDPASQAAGRPPDPGTGNGAGRGSRGVREVLSVEGDHAVRSSHGSRGGDGRGAGSGAQHGERDRDRERDIRAKEAREREARAQDRAAREQEALARHASQAHGHADGHTGGHTSNPTGHTRTQRAANGHPSGSFPEPSPGPANGQPAGLLLGRSPAPGSGVPHPALQVFPKIFSPHWRDMVQPQQSDRMGWTDRYPSSARVRGNSCTD